MLADVLSRVASEYAYERVKPFAASKFGDFVRNDVAKEAKKTISLWPFDLTIKASVGAGNWASVPWLAFFDPLVTKSATRGFYVVYLINAQSRTVVLSMNQGTTEAYNEFGRQKGCDVLMRRAADMVARIPEYSSQFDRSSIDLGSSDDLPLGYQAGHAFGKTYSRSDLNDARFVNDLEMMLKAYRALVDRGGTLPVDFMHEEAGSSDIVETRRYILSRRIERSGKVRQEVLSHRQPVCECCGFEPVKDFGYKGPLKNTPLDVHHIKPLNHLAEGDTQRYRIPEDFFVLCPTCHRMIHKQNDPSDLQALQQRLRFKLMREMNYPMF